MTTTPDAVQMAVREQLQHMMNEDLNPPVESPEDVNKGFCWQFAEGVYERLGCPDDVRIFGAGTMSWNHRWIEHRGTHYDSETVQGVDDWCQLKFWKTRSVPKDAKEVGHR